MRCIICGQIFLGRNRRQETCGERSCQLARKRTRMRKKYAEQQIHVKRKRGPRKPLNLAEPGYGLDFCPFASRKFTFFAAFNTPWRNETDLYPLEFEPGWPLAERMPPELPDDNPQADHQDDPVSVVHTLPQAA